MTPSGAQVLAHAVPGATHVTPGTALGWGLGSCLLLILATWAGTATVHRSTAATLAGTGGLLIGMALLDVLPEALRSGAEQGVGTPVLLGLAALAAGVFWGLSQTACGRSGSPRWRARSSTAASVGLAAHRIAEGATLGLAATSDLRSAALLALALGLRGSCEGAVLAVSLSNAHRSRSSARRWLVLLCSAPFVGVPWGLHAPSPQLAAWILAPLSGLLLAAGAVNLRQAAARLTTARRATLGAAGLGTFALSNPPLG